jgi:cellulase/cellobiase CelA1
MTYSVEIDFSQTCQISSRSRGNPRRVGFEHEICSIGGGRNRSRKTTNGSQNVRLVSIHGREADHRHSRNRGREPTASGIGTPVRPKPPSVVLRAHPLLCLGPDKSGAMDRLKSLASMPSQVTLYGVKSIYN